jgi:branched-chain amino acid transport system substrate-binding protein
VKIPILAGWSVHESGGRTVDVDGILSQPISRRSLLKGIGAATAGGGLLAACGSSGLKGGGSSGSGTLTIGYVSPQTGDLAGFATPDNFVLKTIRATSQYSKALSKGGKSYRIEIVEVDSQSDPNRASEVTRNLILDKHVDMVVTSSAPETCNPVADVCEAEGIPCVATVVPWEAWYFGRGAKPGSTFTYTTMFFFGIPEFGKCFFPMWNRIHKQLSTNTEVACMWPNDADGTAFREGWPPIMKTAGYKVVDGGAYQDGLADFTTMISLFKSKDCDFYLNGPLPPDFNTFWKQANQQGFKPKLATVAKVLLFPADTVALGPLVENIATDAWWTPYSPYASSLTGQTTKSLAAAYQQASGQQWTQSIGSTYSLFEVAYNAFNGASDPKDRKEVAAQLRTMSYHGMCGPIDFAKGPVPGVGIIEPVGVQWKKGTDFPFTMYVVDNSANPNVPLNGTLEPTNA